MTMTQAETLAELIANNRGVKRTISYLEGENSERVVSYGELYERALGILFHLQKLGAKRGDKLIIYLANNEQFLDAFWAGMLGGIVPVPVALGISDEHKHKLLRIARKLGKPFIYTDKKTLDRIGAFAGEAGEQATYDALASRAGVIAVEHTETIGIEEAPVARFFAVGQVRGPGAQLQIGERVLHGR